MPHESYARIDPSMRKRLTAAAVREFAAHGLAAASLNEILTRAGVGKSSFYYYFGDKEDLFASMIEGVWASMEAQLQPFAFAGSGREGFWDAVEAHQLALGVALTSQRHGADLFRALQPLRHDPSPRMAATFARLGASLRTIIQIGRTHGFVRDDLDEDVLLRLVDGADAALDARVVPATEDLRAHMRLAHDTMRRLLESKAGAA